MNTRIAGTLLACCFFGASVFARAAETTEKKEEETPAIKAVYHLFEVMDMGTTYKQTVSNMLDLQIKQNPQIAPFRDVMNKFFKKHMGWKSIRTEIAKIYVKDFSAEELNELARFYQTPLGKKAAKLLPRYAAQGAAIGQRRVQENMQELIQMIEEEKARLEKEK